MVNKKNKYKNKLLKVFRAVSQMEAELLKLTTNAG